MADAIIKSLKIPKFNFKTIKNKNAIMKQYKKTQNITSKTI